MSSAVCFSLDQSKILSSGNGLSKLIALNLDKSKIQLLGNALTKEYSQ